MGKTTSRTSEQYGHVYHKSIQLYAAPPTITSQYNDDTCSSVGDCTSDGAVEVHLQREDDKNVDVLGLRCVEQQTLLKKVPFCLKWSKECGLLL